MPSFRYGGKEGRSRNLEESPAHVVLRTRSRAALDTRHLSSDTREAVESLERVFQLPEVGVELHRVRTSRSRMAVRDRARAALKEEQDVEFAGRVLWDPRTREPVIYTENLFVKFYDDRSPRTCEKILLSHRVEIKREIHYLNNGYFVGMPGGSGQKVFETAEALLEDDSVQYCHPELVKEKQPRAAFPQQWHLDTTEVDGLDIDAHANVVAAWNETQGEGVVIAVIDDGFDLHHREFRSPGKIVSPRDATRKNDDPRAGPRAHHGTGCAGVACADGLHGASGVAPKARLMPIRLVSMLGSQDEADALVWAAENGADIISCSWGPKDGDPLDPDDPLHEAEHFLPDNTRTALEFATREGRGGRGCVVTWAAGNGNESVDLDQYAANEHVIAVASCNDQGFRSLYSDFGQAIWCSFPSDDLHNVDPRTGLRHQPHTRGIWTTDLQGPAGRNPGNLRLGDRFGNYTNRFGGTSSACPGVAGVVALMLSVNDELSPDDVRAILRQACDPIDPEGGEYDDQGHSFFYGYGRVDAARAVHLALEAGGAGIAETRAAELASAPSSDEVSVTIQGEADEVALWIDQQPLELEGGHGRVCLESGQSYILSWWLRGKPGAPYRIDIEAAKSSIDGRVPVVKSIPKDDEKSAGTRRFTLETVRGAS